MRAALPLLLIRWQTVEPAMSLPGNAFPRFPMFPPQVLPLPDAGRWALLGAAGRGGMEVRARGRPRQAQARARRARGWGYGPSHARGSHIPPVFVVSGQKGVLPCVHAV